MQFFLVERVFWGGFLDQPGPKKPSFFGSQNISIFLAPWLNQFFFCDSKITNENTNTKKYVLCVVCLISKVLSLLPDFGISSNAINFSRVFSLPWCFSQRDITSYFGRALFCGNLPNDGAPFDFGTFCPHFCMIFPPAWGHRSRIGGWALGGWGL